MTIESTTNKAVFDGDGLTTVFDFAFVGDPLPDTDFSLTYYDTDGNATELAANLWTLSLTPPDVGKIWGIGGTVTYDPGTPIAIGTMLVLLRTLPLTQPDELSNQGAFYPKVVERMIDRTVIMLQQQQEILNRALVVASTDDTLDPLPPAANRANMFLAFDGDGNPIAAEATGDGVPISAFWTVMVALTNAADSLTELGFSAFSQALAPLATAALYRTALAVYSSAQVDALFAGNLFTNPDMRVAQRCVLTTAANALGDTLGSTAKIGKVDGFAVYSTGGAITVGSVTQDAAAAIGRYATALHASGMTLTGAGKLSFAGRIEAKAAAGAANRKAAYASTWLHDLGANVNATISVYKPTVADNWAARTLIAQSAAIPIPSGVATDIALAVNDLGACGNGLEVVVELDTGAIAGKNIRTTGWILQSDVDAVGAQAMVPFAIELARCQRWFEKTFNYVDPPQQAIGNANGCLSFVAQGTNQTGFAFAYKVTKRTAPTVVTYNPVAANANWRNTTTASDGTASLVIIGDEACEVLCLTNFAVADRGYIHLTVQAELY